MNHKYYKLLDGFLPGILLILLSVPVYLPFIGQFGYNFDDWYIMFAARTQGAQAIQEIYGIDRPAGALLMIPLHVLFGGNPLMFNISAFVFRVLGALGVLSVGRAMWPHARGATFIISMLFLIYPGFLSQPNGIVYQYYLVALAAAVWSVALTVKAVNAGSVFAKFWLFGLSILLGLFYLAQIEWYIGFEAARWACILVLKFRKNKATSQIFLQAVRSGLPSLLIPGLFLVWRLLFFDNERGATDVGLQLGHLFVYPLQTIFRWVVSQAQNMYGALCAAWVIPFQQVGIINDNTYGAVGLGIGIFVIFLTFAGLRRVDAWGDATAKEIYSWQNEAAWLGLAVLIFGLAPVTLANREVIFPAFSRYTLVASLGAVMLIVSGLYGISNTKIRWFMLSCLIMVSVLTHFGNGLNYARWTRQTREFWWQVSWRVPQFEKNTTLIANMPNVPLEEDYFIWGPANFIYYPESQNSEFVQPALYAAVLNRNTVQKVLTRERQNYNNRRGIITYANYRNIVILTQPSPNSCVHVLDGLIPAISSADPDSIRVIGSFSELEHVLADETSHTPPELIFGPEPLHDWCFYYQKADLARQRGDWETVIDLGHEARKNGFAPSDPVEWIPFLHAYAITGDVSRLMELAPQFAEDPYIALQVCQNIRALTDISDAVTEVIESQYCGE